MEFLGIRGVAYKWLNSYKIKNVSYICVVLQSSTLGSKLFMLDKMSTWFAVNRLTINIYKTYYMLFGNCLLSEDVVKNIQNVNIEREIFAKLLGMLMIYLTGMFILNT